MKKQEPNILPKPFGTYCYRFPGKEWVVGILNSDKGWGLFVKNPEDEIVRLCQFYPSKSEATGRMELELKSLGFSKKEIASLKSTDSYYEYRTHPIIKIYSKGSKWGWRCGKKWGIKKSKKQAIEEACKHRKDLA